MSIAVGGNAGEASAPAWSLRRIVTAGVIGNVLEWYDFAVYGFFAPILAAQFFPADDPRRVAARRFRDVRRRIPDAPRGRCAVRAHRRSLWPRARADPLDRDDGDPDRAHGPAADLATIGIAASFLIVILRMFQGMAVGGEFTSSIVFLAEHAPQKRRGFVASFAMFGATFGTMLGSAVGGVLSSLLSPEDLASWGWRAAFISGIAVAIVGVVLRRNMLDGPRARRRSIAAAARVSRSQARGGRACSR